MERLCGVLKENKSSLQSRTLSTSSSSSGNKADTHSAMDEKSTAASAYSCADTASSTSNTVRCPSELVGESSPASGSEASVAPRVGVVLGAGVECDVDGLCGDPG